MTVKTDRKDARGIVQLLRMGVVSPGSCQKRLSVLSIFAPAIAGRSSSRQLRWRLPLPPTVTRFSINTDVEALISRELPWHQRQLALSKAFPQNGISAVIRAPTQENAEQATDSLAQELSKASNLFRMVVQPDSGTFFERNGLLFETLPDVNKSIGGLTKAQPLIAALAADPNLRGVMKALSFAADGVRQGRSGSISSSGLLRWPAIR